MITCDADDCEREAVISLRFRGQPGHTHVCAEHEAIDREWCDVVESGALCPWAWQHALPKYHATPTLLT